jgi:DNA-directed RNA polymerase alpha subunit
MKINVEFSSLSDMANFTKFINDSLVPPTQKQKTINETQSEVKELRAQLEKYKHMAEDNRRLNELLDRAYMRLQKADPAGATANMKSEKELTENQFGEWASQMLSTRTYNCLQAENIKTFKELCDKTPYQILSIPNLGRRSLRELIDALKQINKSLKK